MLSQVSASGSSIMSAASRNASVTSLMICCGYIVCWSPNVISFFLNLIGVVSMDLTGWYYHFTVRVLPLHRGAGAAQQLRQSSHLRRQVS